ncbi:PucR family transcriptional regulator [Tomitella fengzijianii]|uniref:PucR family transcriptional regulator n=1 Tax=Tomitella fengzijianii TaxID=2597660 RepID=A0A516X6C9_9ACTN|nr:helix-turn-helix domain-containing protein [Tomitella fengzijianii]QDQ98616.1 PucR family transcriptional regulator [Tomitella fengzijianii]
MAGVPIHGGSERPHPGRDPYADPVGDLVGDVVVDVAANMERDLDANSAEVKKLLESHFAEMRGDRHWADLLRASISSNVETVLHALRHGIPAGGIAPPAAAAEFARRMAQHEVPVEVLVRSYRMGLAALQDDFLQRMTMLVTGPGAPVDPAERDRRADPAVILAAVRHTLRLSYEYIDSITEQLSGIYCEERDRWRTGGNSQRVEQVRRVLDGNGERDAASHLRYDLDQAHIAAVLWLPEDSDRADGAATLERAVRDLGVIVGAASGPLAVTADELSVWAWYPLDHVTGMLLDGERVRAAWDPAPDLAGRAPRPREQVSVALGTVGQGIDGFRRSHAHAMLARSVAALADRPAGRATGYDEPGLSAVAMLCTDMRATSSWVAETLGPLADDDESAARLRETIRMFYLHGASHKSAATALHLHANTVKYRIRRAEEMLGRPLQQNRSSIELAVLICYWLGSEVLTD